MQLQKLIVFELLKVNGSSFFRGVTSVLAFILSVVSVKQWHFQKKVSNLEENQSGALRQIWWICVGQGNHSWVVV